MPTYSYADKITGRVYEVVHKITMDPFKTLGDLYQYMGWTWVGTIEESQNPIERQIICEGGATIRGAGVYKSGTISSIVNSQAAKVKTKSNVTKYTAEEIANRKDDDDGE